MTWYVTTDGHGPEPAGSDEDIMGAVRAVCEGEGEFFVVESEEGSETDYIQGSVWTEGVILRASYVAEVRESSDDGPRQWRLRTKDFGEIEDAVRSYISGGEPVWRSWADVTDEIGDERGRGSAW